MYSFSGKIFISKSSLNLRMMLEGGQSFRWKKTGENVWTGVMSNIIWRITQYDSYIEYTANLSETLIKKNISKGQAYLTSNTSDFDNAKLENFLKCYLRINSPLENYYEEWSEKDSYFKDVSSEYSGIRLLDQEPVENLFSFICSSNNNITRISGMVEKLCTLYGPEICEVDSKKFYGFPELTSLTKASVCEDLRKAGFGYRSKYIQQSAQQLHSKGGVDWLISLKEKKYDEAKSELMKLSGIGPKVADCICLMSLGHMNAVPVDTHVFQIASQIYLPHLRSLKSVTDRVYNEIGNFFRNLYGPLAGWAHTILFCADLKTFKPDMNIIKSKSRKRKSLEDIPIERELKCIHGTLDCSRNDLNLRITLNSGQTYRFKEIEKDTWRGVFSNCIWTLTQLEDKIEYTVHYCQTSIMIQNKRSHETTDEIFRNILNKYFRLDFDLSKYYKKWSDCDEHFMIISSKFCGLRMIRQDIVENLFAFVCSSNNTISRMRTMVDTLCSQYGEKIGLVDNLMYYEFPTVGRLSLSSVTEELKNANFGFRAKFIQESAKIIMDRGGELWFKKIQNLTYEDAKKELMTLRGIADKVADCICLTALDHLETIPVDTHVFQIAKKYYLPHLKNQKTITKNVYQEIGHCFRNIFGEYSGWAHTVLFCSDLKQHARVNLCQ